MASSKANGQQSKLRRSRYAIDGFARKRRYARQSTIWAYRNQIASGDFYYHLSLIYWNEEQAWRNLVSVIEHRPDYEM